jgi:signal transduction histidine kinase
MDPKIPEERVKPFRLVKYFTFTGLVVIFLVTILLSVLITQLVRSMQRQNSEDYAHVLIENLNHQVFLRFMYPVVTKYGRIRLSNKEQFKLLDTVVRSTLHSFKVDALNIYSRENTITYSFEDYMVGRENFGGTGYQQALVGKSTSKLIQRGSLLEIMLGFPKEVRLITFAPLRGEKNLFGRFTRDVLGVVELEQDLSQEYKAIFRIQILVITTSTALMGALFVVLIFVVKRGEGIIQRRAMERMQLKERLSQAEKLSAIGEMAAGISHEIRNPLGIIQSSAELLKKKVIKHDPANTIPDIIVEEAGRLNQIITEFINFAKPRSPQMAPCHVQEVVEKNLTFLASQIEEDGYIIKKNFQNSVPEIMADASMLYQSFLNILINAMQAMPEGGRIQIEIGSNNTVVAVNFDDEGQGIPQDNLEKIWDPFFTTKEKGSGLGLGIVKNIIEAHGGRIQISNRDIRGARVTIELPVIPQDEVDYGNNPDS